MQKIEFLKILLIIGVPILAIYLYRIEVKGAVTNKEYEYLKKNRAFIKLSLYMIYFSLASTILVLYRLLTINEVNTNIFDSSLWVMYTLFAYSIGLIQKKKSIFFKKGITVAIGIWIYILFLYYGMNELFFH